MGQTCSRSAAASALVEERENDAERRYTLAAAVCELQEKVVVLSRERDAQSTLLHELSGEMLRLKDELPPSSDAVFG